MSKQEQLTDALDALDRILEAAEAAKDAIQDSLDEAEFEEDAYEEANGFPAAFDALESALVDIEGGLLDLNDIEKD
jgi:hypothetical protein